MASNKQLPRILRQSIHGKNRAFSNSSSQNCYHIFTKQQMLDRYYLLILQVDGSTDKGSVKPLIYGKTAYSFVLGSAFSKNSRTNSSGDGVASCVNIRLKYMSTFVSYKISWIAICK